MEPPRFLATPPERIRTLNDRPVDTRGRYVLYWMTSTRRSRWSFGLDRAVQIARDFQVPVLVLEALRLGYRYASRRLHAFVLGGMRDNKRAFDDSPFGYYPYIEPSRGHQVGLLEACAFRACAVVTDDWPCFFLPKALRAAAENAVPVRFEAVDSCGIHPIRTSGRVFKTANSFRRHIQKNFLDWIAAVPDGSSPRNRDLREMGHLPEDAAARWRPATDKMLGASPEFLDTLALDQNIPEAPLGGGREEALRVVNRFVEERLAEYAEGNRHPDLDATSGLSPFLHFGHVSPHEVLFAVLEKEGWNPQRLSPQTSGKRSGWWGISKSGEAFLDELITWRELGFNMCAERPEDYASFDSLPDWAKDTLDEHREDERKFSYEPSVFEAARTHDPVWNAAQNQLLQEGRIHNYMRMLWGKKILEWSPSPERAVSTMIHLNDKYALDGRDPNSYSGILWCLGRYDRPWGPKRPVFGSVRFMSSPSTRRKLEVSRYLKRYSGKK